MSDLIESLFTDVLGLEKIFAGILFGSGGALAVFCGFCFLVAGLAGNIELINDFGGFI